MDASQAEVDRAVRGSRRRGARPDRPVRHRGVGRGGPGAGAGRRLLLRVHGHRGGRGGGHARRRARGRPGSRRLLRRDGPAREDAAQRHGDGQDAGSPDHPDRLGPQARGALGAARRWSASAPCSRSAARRTERCPRASSCSAPPATPAGSWPRRMVERGMRPVLAARGRERLEAMAAELGGLETAVADVADPASVRALVERGDVLVTTVGPFARWGEPAAAAASSRPAPTTSTRPASRPSSARSSSATGRPPSAVRQRDADRLRLRLGARQPRRRAGARARRRAPPCGSTSATSSPARRR